MENQTRYLAPAAAWALMAALVAPTFAPAPAAAQLSIGVSVNIAPPVLPVYVQPPLPAPGYIWTPGYWAWDPGFADYYWVPGAWVAPPRPGFLWTPGYWGWSNGVYLFHPGYWGPTIGFYGGVNYGFGYGGVGYAGGEWRGGQFFYNSSVSNVTNVNVTNVYNRTVVVNNNAARTSFNGGPNGTAARPTPVQLAAAKAPHVPATAAQVQHVNAAKADPAARLSNNQGKPQHAAAEKPLVNEGEKAPGGETEKKVEPRAAPGAPQVEHPERPAVGTHGPAERPGAEHAPPVQRAPQVEHAPPVQRAPQVERRAPPPRPAPPRPAAPRPAPHPAPQPGAACKGPQCR